MTSDRQARSTLTVLWLDDLEPFLNDGVTLGTLREWHAGARGRIVAATYGGKGSERIAGSNVGGLVPIAAEVLQSAREITLAATTPRELEALRSRVSVAQFASLERHGLAAYLVAAPALERKLATSRHGPGEVECPEGVAIVRTAVDWSRCGRTDAIQEATLRALWRVHMSADEVGTDAFACGLRWALRPVAGTIALLSSRDGYRAYDYIVRVVEQQPDVAAPPDESWASAIESAQDAQAVAVGLRCYVFGRYEDAVNALTTASRSSNDEVATAGSYNLGVVLHEQGDPAGARAAWERTITSGHHDRAPKAALNLGLLLEQQGDPASARVRLQQSIDSGHPDYAPSAMVNLGILLAEQQDPAGARTAYQRAIDTGHPHEARAAMLNLGVLLAAQGDAAGAFAAYQQLIDSGDPAGAVNAMFNRAVLLAEQGDPAARAAFRQVIDSGHTDHAPAAMINLAMLFEHDDAAGAQALYEDAIRSEHPKCVVQASVNLANLLARLGKRDEARAAYERAVDSNDAVMAPGAAVSLGVLLCEMGEIPDALAAYQKAMESGHAEFAPKAAFNLGLVLQAQGDVPGARIAYQKAADSTHLEVALMAQLALLTLPA